MTVVVVGVIGVLRNGIVGRRVEEFGGEGGGGGTNTLLLLIQITVSLVVEGTETQVHLNPVPDITASAELVSDIKVLLTKRGMNIWIQNLENCWVYV